MLISYLVACLLATSAHGKASWSDPVLACIDGNNVEVLTDVSLEECQEKCDSTTSFDCRSVEFAHSGVGGTALFSETCWMSNLTSADTSDFKKPCPGVFKNVLFSEKLGDAAPSEDSTNNSGTGSTDHWTCAFCTKAISALTSHSTSASSQEAELELLVTHVCPAWTEPSSCRTYLPTFWPEYSHLIWSGFWALVCNDENCPLDLPEFWQRTGRSGNAFPPPSCQSCEGRINAFLEFFDGPTALSKFREGLLKYCGSREDTAECNKIGKFIIPGASTLIKLQRRDWIKDICQHKLDCNEDD